METRVTDLLERHRATIAERNELQQKNIELINDLNQIREANAALELQLTTAMAKVKAGGPESKKIKKEIGQYIKAIDKCILMMREI